MLDTPEICEEPSWLTLQDIKSLEEVAPGRFCYFDEQGNPKIYFRIGREFREEDGAPAQHPQITASNGKKRINLILSKKNGWHIQKHFNDFEFNRSVLKYLNCGILSVGEDVFLILDEAS